MFSDYAIHDTYSHILFSLYYAILAIESCLRKNCNVSLFIICVWFNKYSFVKTMWLIYVPFATYARCAHLAFWHPSISWSGYRLLLQTFIHCVKRWFLDKWCVTAADIFFLKQIWSSSVKVDSVTGDAAEVTFVEYGNSAVCALGQLQPWDALIGEDGQLM